MSRKKWRGKRAVMAILATFMMVAGLVGAAPNANAAEPVVTVSASQTTSSITVRVTTDTTLTGCSIFGTANNGEHRLKTDSFTVSVPGDSYKLSFTPAGSVFSDVTLVCDEGRWRTSKVTQPPADSDGDGVPDSSDKCPSTPAGEAVDASGCSASQRDSDGDGVPDANDKCPNVAGPADNNGCPYVTVNPPAAPVVLDDQNVQGDVHFQLPESDSTYAWTTLENGDARVCLKDPAKRFPNDKSCWVYTLPADKYTPPTPKIDLPPTPPLVDS